jgi:hypothetical protein
MPWWLDPVAVRMRQIQRFPEGACITLAIDFLAHNLGVTDNLPQNEDAIEELQRASVQCFYKNNCEAEEQGKFLCGRLGLVVEERRQGFGFMPALLADVIDSSNGALLVSFGGAWPKEGDVPGHSIAVIVGMVFVEFMDSNRGYVRVRKNEFRDKFIKHMDIYYPHLRGRWIVERISRADPRAPAV